MSDDRVDLPISCTACGFQGEGVTDLTGAGFEKEPLGEGQYLQCPFCHAVLRVVTDGLEVVC